MGRYAREIRVPPNQRGLTGVVRIEPISAGVRLTVGWESDENGSWESVDLRHQAHVALIEALENAPFIEREVSEMD